MTLVTAGETERKAISRVIPLERVVLRRAEHDTGRDRRGASIQPKERTTRLDGSGLPLRIAWSTADHRGRATASTAPPISTWPGDPDSPDTYRQFTELAPWCQV